MTKIELFDPFVMEEAVLSLWNAELATSFPLDSRLYRQIVGSGESKPVLYTLGGEAGLDAFALVRGDGHLSALLVRSDARRQGLGSALLCQIEEDLRALSVSKLVVGADYLHFFPGAPECCSDDLGYSAQTSSALSAFLDSHGFDRGCLEYDLRADLNDLDLDALGAKVLTPEGFEVVPYAADFDAETDAFFGRCFPGRWCKEFQDARAAGSLEKTLLLLVTEGGSVAGFCRIFATDTPILGPSVYWRALLGEHWGGLGPIGVDDDYRGRGLGLYLLHRSLLELSRRSVSQMVIDWTDLVDFYAKMGFEIWKSYRKWDKTLLGRVDSCPQECGKSDA